MDSIWGRFKSVVFNNSRIEGFITGIKAPLLGDNVIDGGILNNVNNIVVSTPVQSERTVQIRGDIQFGINSTQNIVMETDLTLNHRDSSALFGQDLVTLVRRR